VVGVTGLEPETGGGRNRARTCDLTRVKRAL
jgi:hypothetical protein